MPYISCKGRRLFIGGFDFLWKGAREHTLEVLQKWKIEDVDYKIGLIHDPRYFQWLPPKFDLVCAGHTHGGQFGLNALGIPISLLRPLGVYDQFLRRKYETYVHRHWHIRLMDVIAAKYISMVRS